MNTELDKAIREAFNKRESATNGEKWHEANRVYKNLLIRKRIEENNNIKLLKELYKTG